MNGATDAGSAHRRHRPAPSERRTRTLDAFIDLVLERGVHPRPEEVAECADVSIASLYRYFSDLDELRNDAVARITERYRDLFVVSTVGAGRREQRIASFAKSRIALHETLHPLELLACSTGHHDPSAQAHVDATRSAMADQVERHFDVELRALGRARRDDIVMTIAALTSVETWHQFRHTHGRSAAQTQRAWITAIESLLPAADPPSGTAD